MAIGPQLPPHLQKRKRNDDDQEGSGSDESKTGELTLGPQPQGPSNNSKRRIVEDSSAPPASPQDRLTQESVDGSESSEDDEYGPHALTTEAYTSLPIPDTLAQHENALPEIKTSQRDEWMTLPPKQDDLAARMDPLRPRARGFNTGKGAKGESTKDTDMSAWLETPEQKRKRLEDEVLGKKKTEKQITNTAQDAKRKAEDAEQARKIREYNERYRSTSLYAQHQSSVRKQEDDDPSKRTFDYERDMGGGTTINSSQKRQMISRAADYSSKFSRGSYL